MKNFTSRSLRFTVYGLLLCVVAEAQTNVSGGIYANTTWTKANSPYIVVDTIVVFPNVTLTIQPGVTVKFDDHLYIEIRQGALIANGTSVDSITFTSNNASPTPGIYEGVMLSNAVHAISIINYCNFRYAHIGLTAGSMTAVDTIFVKNSNFDYNINGLFASSDSIFIDTCNFRNNTHSGIGNDFDSGTFGVINYCTFLYNNYGLGGPVDFIWGGTIKNSVIDSNQVGARLDCSYGSIDNCIIKYNQTGLESGSTDHCIIKNCTIDSNIVLGITPFDYDTLINSEIKYNGIGISIGSQHSVVTKCDIENNLTGINLSGSSARIYCNKICNNTNYDLVYTNASNNNFSMPINYWCTIDSISTEAVIYDGYDNINYGLVSFIPIDTTLCYLSTGISTISNNDYLFSRVFPNPFSTYSTISFSNELKDATLSIYNVFGQRVKVMEHISGSRIVIGRENLCSGIYIYDVAEKERRVGGGKLVVE